MFKKHTICFYRYPFGSVTSGRNFSSSSYRYGYQGSEKDNEVAGSGNDYTTHYRLLDTRLGKWFSIDPSWDAWESPYSSMGNSPIFSNDPLGDKFTKRSQKMVDELKAETTTLIKATEEKITNLSQEKSDLLNKQANGTLNSTEQNRLTLVNTEISNAVAIKNELTNAANEISEMEKSSQVFVIRARSAEWGKENNEGGETQYNKLTKRVVINFVDKNRLDRLAHELKHGHQFIVGELSFKRNDGTGFITSGGALLDMSDEVAANRRQFVFNQDGFKTNLNITSVDQINSKLLRTNRKLNYSSLKDPNPDRQNKKALRDKDIIFGK